MSTYYRKERRTWRYQFRYQGYRHSREGFKTKREAKEAEQKHRQELKSPPEKKTSILFWQVIEKRLEYVQSHYTRAYFDAYRYMAQRWLKEWKYTPCEEITRNMVESFLIDRSLITSNHAANKDLRYLKAVFGWAIDQELIEKNPCARVKKLPIKKVKKYVPSKEDVWKVLLCATQGVQDYLWCIILTLARMGEINRLRWADVYFDKRIVVLWTRKKRGGDLTPRPIHMTEKLAKILRRRYEVRDESKPWVFWQRWWDNQTGEYKEGPYIDRKRIMKTLCRRAEVKYFRFHSLRHFGASFLKTLGVDERIIQEMLGHEELSTTHIYLQSVSSGAKEAMELLEGEMVGEEIIGKEDVKTIL